MYAVGCKVLSEEYSNPSLIILISLALPIVVDFEIMYASWPSLEFDPIKIEDFNLTLGTGTTAIDYQTYTYPSIDTFANSDSFFSWVADLTSGVSSTTSAGSIQLG